MRHATATVCRDGCVPPHTPVWGYGEGLPPAEGDLNSVCASLVHVVSVSGGWPNGMTVGFTMIFALAGCRLATDNLFPVTP